MINKLLPRTRKRRCGLISLTLKKGFTLVEMIVVIAIITIMLAIVIPLLSTSSSLDTEAKEYARSFYSNIQELFTDEKFNGNNVEFSGAYTLVVAETNTDSGTSTADVTVYVNDGLDLTALSKTTLTAPIDTSDSSTDDKAEFANSVSKLLSSIERDGWFYAVIDSKYRVVCAYFALSEDADYDTIAGQVFTDDCRIGDYVVGAYGNPDSSGNFYSLCSSGKTMLADIE